MKYAERLNKCRDFRNISIFQLAPPPPVQEKFQRNVSMNNPYLSNHQFRCIIYENTFYLYFSLKIFLSVPATLAVNLFNLYFLLR